MAFTGYAPGTSVFRRRQPSDVFSVQDFDFDLRQLCPNLNETYIQEMVAVFQKALKLQLEGKKKEALDLYQKLFVVNIAGKSINLKECSISLMHNLELLHRS